VESGIILLKAASDTHRGGSRFTFHVSRKEAARLKILDDVVVRALRNMSSEERRDLILGMVDRLLLEMGASERRLLMEHVVDHFLDALPSEERASTVRELVPRLLAQLMQSGGMSVDELLWAAMGSLGALEQAATEGQQARQPGEDSSESGE